MIKIFSWLLVTGERYYTVKIAGSASAVDIRYRIRL